MDERLLSSALCLWGFQTSKNNNKNTNTILIIKKALWLPIKAVEGNLNQQVYGGVQQYHSLLRGWHEMSLLVTNAKELTYFIIYVADFDRF